MCFNNKCLKKNADPFVLFLLFFGWGHAVICLGFLVGTFISSRRVATVVGYLVALFGSMMGILICAGIYGNAGPFALGGKLPIAFLLYPQFSLCRAVYLLNNACSLRVQCYTSAMLTWEDELTRTILSLYIDAVLYLLLAWYFDKVCNLFHVFFFFLKGESFYI